MKNDEWGEGVREREGDWAIKRLDDFQKALLFFPSFSFAPLLLCAFALNFSLCASASLPLCASALKFSLEPLKESIWHGCI
jgi:hypothetical protein